MKISLFNVLRPVYVTAAVLTAGLAFAGLTAILVWHFEIDRSRGSLERRAWLVEDRILSRITQIGVVLQVSRAFILSQPSEEITREQFAAFQASLGQAGLFEGVRGLGVILLVNKGAEETLFDQFQNEYQITPNIWPKETPYSERAVLTYLEPIDHPSRLVLGYDMYSDPLRKELLDRARITGAPALSGPIEYLGAEDGSDRMALFYAVYFDPENASIPRGFLYTPIRLSDIFGPIFKDVADQVEFRLHDEATPDEPLFETSGFAQSENAIGDLMRSSEISGRRWILTARDGREINLFQRFPMTFVVTGLSIFTAILFAFATQTLNGYLLKTRALTEAQNSILTHKDLHLREMSHRLKNILARVLAMARQAAAGTSDKQQFVQSLTQRLQAMATAQDMLVRSGTGSSDLRALIGAEMAQIYGNSSSQVSIEGPDVVLQSEQTEAIGLAIHELATNSLKYGAGVTEAGHITVTWDLHFSSTQRILQLYWREFTGFVLEPPARTGFGTRLVDGLVKMTLGGTIKREFTPDGLNILIHFPISKTAADRSDRTADTVGKTALAQTSEAK